MMSLPHVPGFRVAGVSCGLKPEEALDLAFVVGDHPCVAAGLFTTNRVKAAPVLYDQQVLANPTARVRAVVINAGNANACTGQRGLADVHRTAQEAATLLGCEPQQVLVLSTGVIGVPLPVEKIVHGLQTALPALRPDGWEEAARAIMTTDTRPKLVHRQVMTPEGRYTILGIAKGAGMIAPHMATMLALLVTDAAVPAPRLRQALTHATDASFNRIVVDGDMSTNDTVLLLSSGASGVRAGGAAFTEALTQVAQALAQAIVRDGEGATKFIEVRVTGARTPAEAEQIAQAIARSPLVKTAFYGGDPNWGRILAAAGYSGVALDPDRLALWFAPGTGADAGPALQLVADGQPTDYDEAQAIALLAHDEVTVRLDLGMGEAEGIVWTCDLSHDYVTINAHYRT